MDPFLGEIRLFAFDFVPRNWAFCSGQLLPIAQNQALFALLGTQYGGNGVTTFALPDLRGRAPMHFGTGVNLSPRTQGERAGAEYVTLSTLNLPAHTHALNVANIAAGSDSPGGALFGSTRGAYAEAPDVTLSPATIGLAGNSQAHHNMPPYLVMNYCIAMAGVFPVRPTN